jgi:hypothetical protein
MHLREKIPADSCSTPSKFMVEYGWGGRSIDPDTWTPQECVDGPSLWGRMWLSPEKREEARAIRVAVTEAGWMKRQIRNDLRTNSAEDADKIRTIGLARGCCSA